MYFDAKGNLDAKWVDAEALCIAQEIVRGRPCIKSAQLRKFYGEFKSLERQWTSFGKDETAFLSILPLVRMTNAKVAYATARTVTPPSFKTWLCKHVDAIKTPKHFEAFLLHFEAIVGFAYGEGLKDSQ